MVPTMPVLLSQRARRIAHRAPSRGDASVWARAVLGSLALLAVLLLSLPGCGGSADPPPATTSSTLESALAPLKRAYQNLSALSTYAVSMQTWQIRDGSPALVLTTEGAVSQGWLYLLLHGLGEPPREVELALSEETALARLPGAVWAPAADVFGADPRLQDLPLEDPTPLKDLLPAILAKASALPLSAASIPDFAPPVPPDAGLAYRWQTELVTGTTLNATVTSTAWLDDRERLIRVDRETVPSSGADVEHTYNSISYSRFADPDIQVPVPPGGYEPGDGSTSTTD